MHVKVQFLCLLENQNTLHLLVFSILFRNLEQKKYSKDHHTPNTVHSFGDSVQVCKMHDYYCRIHKSFEQHFIPSHSSEASYYNGQTTILAKTYETNFSVSVKQSTVGKVQFKFLNSFLLVLTTFSFWEEDQVLGYDFMKI